MKGDKAKTFLDTNIFVYLYTEEESDKSKIAFSRIKNIERIVSTQVINEFCNVLMSEDMADNQIIENTLTIKNIFK